MTIEDLAYHESERDAEDPLRECDGQWVVAASGVRWLASR